MRLVSDWRYVSQGETEAFRNADSADLRERAFAVFTTEAEKAAKAVGKPFDPAAYREAFMKEIPLGSLEMRFAFEAKGDDGAWVRQRAAVARINGILFMHGGISEPVSMMGCEGINAAVRKDLLSVPVPLEQVATLFSASETGPLYRSRQRARGVAGADARRHPRAHESARDRDRPHHGRRQAHATPWRARHSDRHGDGERRVLSRWSRVCAGVAGQQGDRDLSRSPRAAGYPNLVGAN